MSAHVRLFVFGLGYSATRLAMHMRGQAEWIGGTVRTVRKAVELSAEPRIRPYVFDGATPGVGIAEAVKVATHVLVSVPPGADGDPVLAQHRETLAAATGLEWLGYLSTVGVYGDRGGDWVDEATAPAPVSERSIRRLHAETAWVEHARERNVPLAIFRIAGIYGPGRNTFVNLAGGNAHRIVKPGQVFNRIHVDDIAAALAAAVAQRAAGVFNLADDEPAPPQEVVSYAAGLMDVPPPPEVPYEAADLSPMARSFYAENKRVANGRLGRDLDVSLRYPTYREGLSSMWSDGTWQG